jgi:DNA-binding response OmpR family regulator
MNRSLVTNKVLIVDDEQSIRLVIAEALRSWGFDPVEAGTASAATAMFDQSHPVAALLDINLPDGSGLTLLRAFKRHQPRTAVIIITGEVIVENTISALRGGADDFIGKPINLAELEYALRNSVTPRQWNEEALSGGKTRLLIATDSTERLKHLSSRLRNAETEVAGAKSPEELKRSCQEEHDLVVVDLAAEQLKEGLEVIRTSAGHTDIPVLVAADRVVSDPRIRGVLPTYRAMPCNHAELLALAQRRLTTISQRNAVRRIL